jgi:hypothetical protein
VRPCGKETAVISSPSTSRTLARDWSSVATANGRIWWPKADPDFKKVAAGYAADLDSGIWSKFQALLHVEPPAVGKRTRSAI